MQPDATALGSFKVNNSFYIGQVQIATAQGIGKLFGDFGIYEGEFVSGKATGWARYIDSMGNYYEGLFQNGAYHGTGDYKMANGTSITGVWVQGELKDIHKNTQRYWIGFKPSDPIIPTAQRSESALEKQLVNLLKDKTNFDSALNPMILRAREKQPYFDLGTLISGGAIKLDETLKIGVLTTKGLQVGSAKHYSYYSGQLDQRISANGIGKASGYWGIYEGNFVGGQPNGTGRMFDKFGNQYDGSFKNGKYHGEGVRLLANKKTFSGIWENGKVVKCLEASKDGCDEGAFKVSVTVPHILRQQSLLEQELNSKAFSLTSVPTSES